MYHAAPNLLLHPLPCATSTHTTLAAGNGSVTWMRQRAERAIIKTLTRSPAQECHPREMLATKNNVNRIFQRFSSSQIQLSSPNFPPQLRSPRRLLPTEISAVRHFNTEGGYPTPRSESKSLLGLEDVVPSFPCAIEFAKLNCSPSLFPLFLPSPQLPSGPPQQLIATTRINPLSLPRRTRPPTPQPSNASDLKIEPARPARPPFAAPPHPIPTHPSK